MSEGNIIVLGLGNLTLGDEGLGVHALRQIRETLPFPDVTCYDGGTRGLSLLPYLEGATHLLILDAIDTPGRPGSLVELNEGLLASGRPMKFSVHDVALGDLLALLQMTRRRAPTEIRILGLIPKEIRLSTDLSPSLQAALPGFVSRAREIVHSWRQPASMLPGAGAIPKEESCA